MIVLSRDEKEFVRFLNMAINDVTYLLDESLQLLRKIHDIETDMDNKHEWDATSMVNDNRLDTCCYAYRMQIDSHRTYE
jgi:cell division septum initiation protein DivIVA